MGESVVAQLQLYLHSRVRRVAAFQITAAPEGLNLGKMLEGQRRQVQVSNVIYTIIPVQVAFTATKAGTFPASSLSATAVLEVQPASRRRDPFIDPFDMLGGGKEQHQVTLATEPERLQLMALPRENMPPLFNGAVGNYTLSESAGPTNVTAGDPITVKVQISGRGSIDAVTLPEQPGWENFKKFPCTSKVETTDQLGSPRRKRSSRRICTPTPFPYMPTHVHAIPPCMTGTAVRTIRLV